VPENEFFQGTNYINFLVGIQGRMFAVSKIGGFWYYNPQANTWIKKGNLPTAMASSNFSVVFNIEHKGYLIGNGTSRQYNLSTDQWTTRNNAPVGSLHVDYSVSLILGNKAYMVGSTNNMVTLYDPATDSYTLKNKFPDVGAAAGFVVNGAGYCIQENGRCWKYDEVNDNWQQKASLPPSVYNMSGFTLNGFGYIIGDVNRAALNGNGRMKLWRYDPDVDQWKQLNEDYPGEGVYAIRTVSLDGIVYVGLGYNRRNQDAIDFWSFR
jgi:N-acetylneuraminic acid mutarotase